MKIILFIGIILPAATSLANPKTGQPKAYMRSGLTKTEVSSVIETVALQKGWDPVLLKAIAHVESSMNPKAVGKIGELGLFQMRPEFHAVKPNMNVKEQTLAAIKHLEEVKQRCGDRFLQCWNMGTTKALSKGYKHTRYEKKVANAYKNILHSGSLSSFKGRLVAGEKVK